LRQFFWRLLLLFRVDDGEQIHRLIRKIIKKITPFEFQSDNSTRIWAPSLHDPPWKN